MDLRSFKEISNNITRRIFTGLNISFYASHWPDYIVRVPVCIITWETKCT